MAVLNITYRGQSADYQLALDLVPSDDDIRRIAVELLRATAPDVPTEAFDEFVVDRMTSPTGEDRIYLRPKVPFGA